MRKTAKVIFLGPISRSNGEKKGHGFSTLQADGGLILLEYPSRKAAAVARRSLAKADYAVAVSSPELFGAIAMAINEAKELAQSKGRKQPETITIERRDPTDHA